MGNVLKGFVGIIFSCFGIGISIQLPTFLQLISLIFFVITDIWGLYCVWSHSRYNMWGVFCTFFPSFVFVVMIHSQYFIYENGTNLLLFSLECSFALSLSIILVWWAVILYEKIKWNVQKSYEEKGIRNLVPFF